jgi:GTPase
MAEREFARATVTSAEAGQCVSFALKRVRKQAVRKGMVIVNKSDDPPKGSGASLHGARYQSLTNSQ